MAFTLATALVALAKFSVSNVIPWQDSIDKNVPASRPLESNDVANK